MPSVVTWTDGPTDCHTERSKSDREKQISYIAYMSDLKKKKVQRNLFTKQKESEMWKTTLWLSKGITVRRSVVPDSLQPHGLKPACQAPPSVGILQARILEWVAMPFSRGSSQPRD